MGTQLSPYLKFNGRCREAMTFYKECFGGELTMTTIKDSPMAERCPAGMEDQLMHSMLVSNGMVLMGTDMNPPGGFIPGNEMDLSLNFDNEAVIHDVYAKLSAGGQVVEPLKKASWGALFAVLKDKFGKVWMLNYAENQH
ncbi:MAG TPA: VOC family protein [Chitinophaga sp.]|uniref:VOC family protein n=1 Tax=Chitinophaga sp. TaxID=1869181 RepID=UPI002BC840EF|nr:VOC family protein [Chitinophaga sp.]HVI46404.1 VOC family protein [Chitinophaga sp.]